MEKNLKDYAAYYLGCRCLNTWFPVGHAMYDNEWKLDGYREHSPKPYLLGNTEDETWTDSIKLVLRKITAMTEEEKNAYHLLCGESTDGVHSVVIRHDTPESFHYLLKQGFDLWDLIESRLAVDAATLTK